MDVKENDGEHCICGVSITYRFHIRNDETNHRVHVGSECIKQFANETLKEEAMVALKDYKREKIQEQLFDGKGYEHELTYIDYVDKKLKFSLRRDSQLYEILDEISTPDSSIFAHRNINFGGEIFMTPSDNIILNIEKKARYDVTFRVSNSGKYLIVLNMAKLNDSEKQERDMSSNPALAQLMSLSNSTGFKIT
jgi:hypothetical protein